MVWKYFRAENADVFPGIILKNLTHFKYEYFLHETFFPYIIHPHSRFRVYWEIFMQVFWILEVPLLVFLWGTLTHLTIQFCAFLALIQFLGFVDLTLTFFTGYVEDRTDIIVLVPKKIAKKYVLGTFVLDVFACIPYEVLSYLLELHCGNVEEYCKTPCEVILFLCALSSFFRTGTIIRYLRNTCRVMFCDPFVFFLISFCCYYFLVIFVQLTYSVLMKFFTHDPSALPAWEDAPTFISMFLETIFFMNFEFKMGFDWESVVRIPSLIFDFFFSVFITAYLIKYARFKMRAMESYLALETSVRIFVRKRQLPLSLRQKTLLYFQVFLHDSRHKDDEIVNYFPDTYRTEFYASHRLPMLRAFYAFEDLPGYVLRRMVEHLKYQLHLPNDIIMSKDESKLSLYFIQRGTVALYDANNTELYHFEEGSTFNDKNFLEENMSSNQYAISLEVTEIYRLDHEDFVRFMATYPKLLQIIKDKFAKLRTEARDFVE